MLIPFELSRQPVDAAAIAAFLHFHVHFQLIRLVTLVERLSAEIEIDFVRGRLGQFILEIFGPWRFSYSLALDLKRESPKASSALKLGGSSEE